MTDEAIRFSPNQTSTFLNFTFLVDGVSQETDETFSLNITDVRTAFQGDIEIQSRLDCVIQDSDGTNVEYYDKSIFFCDLKQTYQNNENWP